MCPDEAVYNQLYTSLDSNQSTIERPPVDPSLLAGDLASKAQPNTPTLGTVTSAIFRALEDKSDNTRSDTHNEEEDPTFVLSDNLEWMAFTSDDQFLRMSSGTMLRTAFKLKNEYIREVGGVNDPSKPALRNINLEFRGINSVPLILTHVSVGRFFVDLI